MKRWYWMVLVSAGLFLSGCAGQQDFWQHKSMYSSPEHMTFSIYGFRTPTHQSGQLSQSQGWWGIDVPYIPAQ